jgi:hypothetical protein
MGYGGSWVRRAIPVLLAALMALFVLGPATSSGTSATSTATAASLELVKTADAHTVDAGDPIGFQIGLTNHREIRNQGRIIIEKRIEPNWAGLPLGSTNTISFSGDLGDFDLGIFYSRTFAAQLPGTYTVTQGAPPGAFRMTGLVCEDSEDSNSTWDVPTRAARIELEAGETVRCVFTNSEPTRGRIIIEKRIEPNWENPRLSFSGDLGDFDLGIFYSQTFATRLPGTYTVTQAAPPGAFQLTGLVCEDSNSTWDVPTRTARIELDAGETVRCVFTNTDPDRQPNGLGLIIIEKQAPADQNPLPAVVNPFHPGGSFTPDKFPCTLDGGFAIGAGGEFSCNSLAPDTYTVTETALLADTGDGVFVSLKCYDPNGNTTWDLQTRTATIRLEADESVRCVFVNRDPDGLIIIEKQAPADQNPLITAGGSFTPDKFPCTLDGGFAIGAGGEFSCNFLAPDTYAVTETAPTSSVPDTEAAEFVSLECDDPNRNTTWDLQTRTATIRLEDGETVRCVFVNRTLSPADAAQNVVISDQLPTGRGLSWSIDPAVPGCTITGTFLSCSAAVLADRQTLSVHVTSPTTTASCGRYENTAVARADNRPEVSAAAAVTVVCPAGSVTLKKTTNGVVDPSKHIAFVLTGPDLPSGGVTASTFGDQDGVLEFGEANLTPGQTYKICETPVPAGFTSFWKLDGTVVTPYNPDATRTPPEDLGVRCYDFSVAPAQERAFEVDNSRPGRDPRTIGYWKNWNRCTSGNQAATAQKNGGAAAGFFLVEDLLPQLIGDVSVTTCQQAVKLLSKQDQSGRNKASDAAYELGAQLLAARFNLAAGAQTCPAVQQAVLEGQTLLDQIGFIGSGDYLGSKSKDVRRTQALSLAATLDSYNNGNLC